MRGKFHAAILAGWVAVAPSALGQGFWADKDYQTWTLQDCQQLLKDSPWAGSYGIARSSMQILEQQSAVAGREEAPTITYVAQLWSARPIRQAIVRKQQLDPKYAKLSPAQKQALDQQFAKFIETEFPDIVVVQVYYGTNAQIYDQQLAEYWQHLSEDRLKTSINLIGAHGRVAPMQAKVAPGTAREMQLIFPRQFQGDPMVRPNDKTLALEFVHPRIGILPADRVYIRFDVKKMMLGEKLIF